MTPLQIRWYAWRYRRRCAAVARQTRRETRRAGRVKQRRSQAYAWFNAGHGRRS